jgi:Flp pilus assembly protein TadB
MKSEVCPVHPLIESTLEDLRRGQAELFSVAKATQKDLAELSRSVTEYQSYHDGIEKALSDSQRGINWTRIAEYIIQWGAIAVISTILVLIALHASWLVDLLKLGH